MRYRGLWAGMMMLALSELAAAAVTVSFAEVKQQQETPVKWFNGVVASRENIELSAELGGKITHMSEFGARIKAGEEIAGIDSRQLELQLKTAQLKLDKARSKMQHLRTELQRQEKLHERRSVSEVALNRARHEYTQARLDAELAAAEAARLQDLLDRASIKAPFSGIINQRFQQAGEYVSAGDRLVQLINTDALDIRVQVPIDLAANLANGKKLLIGTEGDADREASIFQRSATADAKSRLVELRLKPETSQWLPGAPVKVAVPVLMPELSRVVPRDAVILSAAGRAVFRIETDDAGKTHVRRVPVKVLYGNDLQVSVAGELSTGDRVVVRGGSVLKDNDEVQLL
ncbi:efflux RND transporter periplasmic adaptor subunit [Spongorhabdus nitratireducens]